MDRSYLIIILALTTFALVCAWMYRSKKKAQSGTTHSALDERLEHGPENERDRTGQSEVTRER